MLRDAPSRDQRIIDACLGDFVGLPIGVEKDSWRHYLPSGNVGDTGAVNAPVGTCASVDVPDPVAASRLANSMRLSASLASWTTALLLACPGLTRFCNVSSDARSPPIARSARSEMSPRCFGVMPLEL